jgi:hypothetical protein
MCSRIVKHELHQQIDGIILSLKDRTPLPYQNATLAQHIRLHVSGQNEAQNASPEPAQVMRRQSMNDGTRYFGPAVISE